MDFIQTAKQTAALTRDCPYETANLANMAALLWQEIPDINWVGFYKWTDGMLILGPFQGKPACIRITSGQGVCGTAAARDQIQCIPDVHAFCGHIACDSASRSELVIPLHAGGKIWGVLDIDSPTEGRFTQQDAEGMQAVCREIEAFLSENYI